MQEESYNDSSDNAIIYFLSQKLIGKVFKFNIKVTSFNYNSSSAGLTVTSFNYNSSSAGLTVTGITDTPIKFEEVQ